MIRGGVFTGWFVSTFFNHNSLPNHLHQYPLGSSAVEFAVEDLFPGAEVEFSVGDGDDDFSAHDLAFVMSVGVVFTGAVVVVALRRSVEGGEVLEPFFCNRDAVPVRRR